MEVLNDTDIKSIPTAAFVDPIIDFLVADFGGLAIASTPQVVDLPAGTITFATGGFAEVAGFRAYETFRSDNRVREDQIVAVWDTDSCQLKGVCFGTRLGAIGAGVLGGLAVSALMRVSIATCGIIGTGLQAEAQLLGISARYDLREVRVFSRNPANRETFVERVRTLISPQIRNCENAEEAVRGVDVVVLATNSRSPVVDASWLEGASHITTVGPKSLGAHELPLDAIEDRLLVSDNPQQIRTQGRCHMLFGHSRWGEVRHLGEILCRGRPERPPRSLYLSAGLAGTEVTSLNAAINHVNQRS